MGRGGLGGQSEREEGCGEGQVSEAVAQGTGPLAVPSSGSRG